MQTIDPHSPHSSDLPAHPELGQAEPEFPMGRVVGRYVLARKLGEGGMGVVYEAYDPELDRKLALKFFHECDVGADAQSRASARETLLREAQAMAAVDHPHVISVYDVGVSGERVYIVMELIRGQNLREWLAHSDHSLETKLALACDLAEGLAAVHACGLVHRDFKPDNVLVGRDGRVYIMDFGLAIRDTSSGPVTQPPVGAAVPQTGASTQKTPVIAGTPGYMAPEQHRGLPATASSDQYAFAATLYEMLYGRRPFHGRSLAVLARAKARARLSAPMSTVVPKPVFHAIARGLAPDPNARFADMASLRAVLAEELAEARPRGLYFFLLTAIASLVCVAPWLHDEGADEARCASAQVVDAVHELWSAEIADRVARQFSASGAPQTRAIIERVHRSFAERSEQWTEVHERVCAGWTGSKTLEFDVSMDCLDRRVVDMAELIELFHHADAEIAGDAVALVNGLPEISVCGRPEDLQFIEPTPSDPRMRAEVTALRAVLDRLHASVDGRDPSEVERSQSALLALAEATEFPAALAETHFVLGYRSIRRGRVGEGLEQLRRAIEFGKAHKHDALVAKAMSWAVFARVYRMGERSVARDMAGHLLSLAERIESMQAVRIGVLEKLAPVYAAIGDLDGAEAIARDVAEQYLRILGPEHASTGLALQNHGVALALSGQLAAAHRQLSRSVAIDSQVFGPFAPKLRHSLSNLSIMAHSLGQDERAVQHAERGALIHEKAGLPPDTMAVRIYRQYGVALMHLGRYAEARAAFERLAVIIEGIHGAGARQSQPALRYLIDLAMESDDAGGVGRHCNELAEITNPSLEANGPPDLSASTVGVLILCAHHRGDAERVAALYPLFDRIDAKPADETWAVAVGPRVRAMRVRIAADEPAKALVIAEAMRRGLAAEAIEDNATHFPLYEQQARALLALGELEPAAAAVERALELGQIQLPRSSPRLAPLHALARELALTRAQL